MKIYCVLLFIKILIEQTIIIYIKYINTFGLYNAFRSKFQLKVNGVLKFNKKINKL